jgi:membrane fusion protein
MTFGQYTHRAQVTGQLEPAAGIVKVVAPNSGRVTHSFIEDGNYVTAGQPLYELSAERGSGSGATDLRIDGALAMRHEERQHTLQLQLEELRHSAQTLEKRQRSLETELITRRQEIAFQSTQVRNASNKLIRYAQLSKQGFISRAQFDDVATELAAQQGRTKSLEAAMLTAQRELLDTQGEARTTASKIELAMSQAKQELAAIEQESAEHDIRSRFRVNAPISGIVAALGPELGQFVANGTSLVTILPTGSHLQARLFAPSRAIAFVEVGQQVWLRFDAFPYQKFGQIPGTVIRVDQAPLSEAAPGVPPLYRVTVRLEKQGIIAYGRSRPFKPGMIVQADILQDRRRLIEWLFEPLFSVTKGRVN